MSTVLPEPLLADDALPRVLDFSRRHGRPATLLAMHAALPLGLSPELAHLLRVNFVREAPFIAEADLLLSPLCREVGGGMYEMDSGVRDLLLGELGRARGYGPERLHEVAEFLFHYAGAGLLDAVDPDVRDHLRVQQWVGLSYLAPERAAEELARTLRAGVERGDRGEALRVVRLTGALATPLLGQVELMRYAGAVARAAAGDARGAVLVAGAGTEATSAAEPVMIGRETLPGIERVIGLWDTPGLTSDEGVVDSPEVSQAAEVSQRDEGEGGTEERRGPLGYRAAKVLVLGEIQSGKTKIQAAIANVPRPQRNVARPQPAIRWEVPSGDGEADALDVFFSEPGTRLELREPALRVEVQNAAAALLVLTNSEATEAERWLDELERCGMGSSRVVMVYTVRSETRAAPLLELARRRGAALHIGVDLTPGGDLEQIRHDLLRAIEWSRQPAAASREDARAIESRVHALVDSKGFVPLDGETRGQLRHSLTPGPDVESRLDRALNCMRAVPDFYVLGTPVSAIASAALYTRLFDRIANMVNSTEDGVPAAAPDELMSTISRAEGRELIDAAMDEWVRLGWAYKARTRRGQRLVIPSLLRVGGSSEVPPPPDSVVITARWPGSFADIFVLLLVHLAGEGRVEVYDPTSARVEGGDSWIHVRAAASILALGGDGSSRLTVSAGGTGLDVAELRRTVRETIARYLSEEVEPDFTEPVGTFSVCLVIPRGDHIAAGEPVSFERLRASLFEPAVWKLSVNRSHTVLTTRVATLPGRWEDAPDDLRRADLVLVDVTALDAHHLRELRLLPGARTQHVVLFREAGTSVPEPLRDIQLATYRYGDPDALRAQVEQVAAEIERVLDVPSTGDGGGEGVDDAGFDVLLEKAAQVAQAVPEEAVALFTPLVEARPEDPRAYLALARLYERLQRPDEAEALLRRGLDVVTAPGPLYLELGGLLERVGRVDEAEGVYRRGASAEHSDAGLPEALGRLLERTGRVSDAIEVYAGAISAFPYSRQLHLRLGAAWESRGRVAEAEKAYREGLSSLPGDAALTGAFGRLLIANGRHAEAVELYRQALEREPDDPELLMGLGAALERAGDLDGAERAYLEAVPFQVALGEVDADWAVAELLARRGEYERALTHYRAVADRRPEWLPCLIRMAETELRLAGRPGLSEEMGRRFDRAEADLVEQGGEDDPQTLGNLGIVQLFRGDSTQFMQYLLRAARNANDPRVLAPVLERLNGLEDVERLLLGLGEGIDLLREAIGYGTPEAPARADSAAHAGASGGPGVKLRVIGQLLNVRAEDGLGAAAIDRVREGDRLDELERRGDWVRVRTPSGVVGFVPAGGVVPHVGAEAGASRPEGFGARRETTREGRGEWLRKAVEEAQETVRINREVGVQGELASSLNNVSLLYSDMARLETTREGRGEWLRKAVEAVEEAARITRELSVQSELASSLKNLSNRYSALAELETTREGRGEWLRKAVEAVEEEARINREVGVQGELASSLNHVSLLYSDLAGLETTQEGRGEWLRKAVEAVEEAVRINHELGVQSELALSLNNISLLYSDLAGLETTRESRGEWLRKAVEAVQEAVRIRRELGVQGDLAKSLNNVSNRYSALAGLETTRQGRGEWLRKAMEAVEEAVRINRELGVQGELALLLNNVSLQYVDLAGVETTRELRGEWLRKAVETVEEAVSIYRELGVPGDLAISLRTSCVVWRMRAEKEEDPTLMMEELQVSRGAIRESVALFRETGDTPRLMASIRDLVIAEMLLYQAGEPVDAAAVRPVCMEGRNLAEALGDEEAVAFFEKVLEQLR
jgi:tetratricopeptide (TPR) repeat protein